MEHIQYLIFTYSHIHRCIDDCHDTHYDTKMRIAILIIFGVHTNCKISSKYTKNTEFYPNQNLLKI